MWRSELVPDRARGARRSGMVTCLLNRRGTPGWSVSHWSVAADRLCAPRGVLMGRRGGNRQPGLESECWRLLPSGVGTLVKYTIEVCRLVVHSQDRLPVGQPERWDPAAPVGR